jgi:hypothetical protein
MQQNARANGRPDVSEGDLLRMVYSSAYPIRECFEDSWVLNRTSVSREYHADDLCQ